MTYSRGVRSTLRVVPFAGGNLGDAALGEGLAGRDDLHDGGAVVVEVALDGLDQRRALHRREEVREETLLRAFEGAAGGGLGPGVADVVGVDAGRFEGVVEVVVDDPEGVGVLVVDAVLLVGQDVLEDVDLYPAVRQRAGLVAAEGLQVAADHLESGHSPALHRLDEVRPGDEGGVGGRPESEAVRIAQSVDGAGSGRADVEDAGLGQHVLELHAGLALLARGDGTALAAAAGGVAHRVALVEDDHAVPGVAGAFGVAAGEPGDDLLEAGLVAVP